LLDWAAVTGTLPLSVGALVVAAELAVGVAPFEVLGLGEEDAAELRATVEELLSRGRGDLRLVPGSDVDRAVGGLHLEPGALGVCLREPACAASVARAAGADRLVLGSAAALGRTYVLRLALLDAEREVADREVSRTVVGGPADLRAAMPEQLERLLPLPLRPWYTRWWVWTTVAVGAAAVAAAVTLAVLLPETDDIPVFPLP
jgi:hypothetical protein